MKYQFFYSTKGDWGFCSNFYPVNLMIDDEKWLSTEAYYQAMKYRGKGASAKSLEYSSFIRKADGPAKVKALGSQKKHRFGAKWKLVLRAKTAPGTYLVNDIIDKYGDVKMRSDWEKVKVDVMIKAVVTKFLLPEFRELLIKLPDDTVLVEHCPDGIWGDGAVTTSSTVGKGTNYLGKILTSVAHVLKHGSCKNMYQEMRRTIKIGKHMFEDEPDTNVDETKVEETKVERLLVYTDGSCMPNPGKGGWGYIALPNLNGKEPVRGVSKEIIGSGSSPYSTNNIMELTAVIEVIKAFPDVDKFLIASDSQITIGCATGTMKRHKNLDLWAIYDKVAKNKDIKFRKVAAHPKVIVTTDDYYNDKVDKIAKNPSYYK